MTDTKNLIKELNNLGEGAIVLIETTTDKMLEVQLSVTKWLSHKKYAQIILSTSRPCKNLLNLYKKNNIDINKIIILCTCCPEKEENMQENNNVIHLPSSSSLTEISLSLSECMESIKDKKFILIESINTLLIHNQPNTLAKFIHSILTKMRINNVSGLLISLEAETDKEVKAEIAQLCDKIIEV
ncbi:MAG: hypothetical protein V1847_04305 [Candidatus Diapherotrites archaeon]